MHGSIFPATEKSFLSGHKIVITFLCFVLTLQASSVLAQARPPILDAAKPKKGIYRNFQEFLNNAPSIRSPFEVICKSGANKIERGTADYRLILIDSIIRQRDITKYWGACDGENIYINEYLYCGQVNFKKIHGTGRYCYFKGSLVSAAISEYPTSAPGGAIGVGLFGAAVEIDVPYIININNGKIFLLDKDVLKTILKRDEQLFGLYDDEVRRSNSETLLSYVARYNERHEDEIKYNSPEPSNIVFYRRKKNERPEQMPVNVGDSIQFLLGRSSTEQIIWTGDSLDLCLGSYCKTIALEKRKISYIECSWKRRKQKFERVDREVGEFYVRGIVFKEKTTRMRQ